MIFKMWQHSFQGEILGRSMCTHKAHLWVLGFKAKMHFCVIFGRNFCVCASGGILPEKVFGPRRKMALPYILNKQIEVTPKTREDMMLQSYVFLKVMFGYTETYNSLFKKHSLVTFNHVLSHTKANTRF